MSNRPHLLYLTHRIPYPPDKGDKIRSFRILKYLSSRFRVHLGCFVDDPDDFRHSDAVRQYTESQLLVPLKPLAARLRSLISIGKNQPLSLGFYEDARMRAFVSEIRQSPLAGEIAFSSQMAPYVLQGAAAPTLVDLCDADSEKWRQYAETAHGPLKWIYAREADRLSEYELRVVATADAALIISAAEGEAIGAGARPARPLHVFANGVDADFFNPEAADKIEGAEVVFVGAMDYRANVEAAAWFVEEVWPRVRKQAPRAQLGLVGSRPAQAIRTLDGKEGVFVTGRVADVRPYLAAARAVVAPLRVARGVQNKVLEAMAMARPVVATPAANAGIDAAVDLEILSAETPEAFADMVLRLMQDPALGDRIGAAARRRIVAEFLWDRRLEDFEKALSCAGIAPRTRTEGKAASF